MREILFRGKRCDNGEWVDGFLIKECNYATCSWNLAIEYKTDRFGKFAYDVAEIIPESISEFTGFIDKNGKKIFEGDIVAQNWYDHNEPADDSFGEVVFCEYDCSFSVMDVEKDGIVPLGKCHAYHWEAEVIGNIHDNPELLENT